MVKVEMPMVSNSLTLTCGEVMNTGNLCNEPAVFRYHGIVHIEPGETYFAALERRGRIVKTLCLEHTRSTLIMMESALKAGTVQIECLEFKKLTLHCRDCYSAFRVEQVGMRTMRDAAEPTTAHYCPNCGAQTVNTVDPELDYWEILSTTLGDLPVALTQAIYNKWLADKQTTTRKFVTYVQEIIEELDAE